MAGRGDDETPLGITSLVVSASLGSLPAMSGARALADRAGRPPALTKPRPTRPLVLEPLGREDVLFGSGLLADRSRQDWSQEDSWLDETFPTGGGAAADRSQEVGSREVGSREVGSREVGSREVGSRGVGSWERGMREEAMGRR